MLVIAALAAGAPSLPGGHVISEATAALDALAGRVDPAWVAPLLLTVLWHYLAEPARWSLYLRHHFGCTLRRLAEVFSLTALLSYMLPAKLGLPLRILLLRRYLALGFGTVSAILGLDGLIYYTGWGLAALISLPWAMGLGWGNWHILTFAGGATVLGLLVLVIASRRPGMLPRRLHRFAQRCWNNPLSQFCGASGCLDARLVAGAALINAADILGHVLRHWVLLALLGQTLAWPVVFAVTTLSIFAGMASLMPMGLGGYDLTLAFLLTHQGLSIETAAAVALSNRLANLGMSLVLGIWAGASLGFSAFNREALTRLTREAQGDSGETPGNNSAAKR